MFKKSEKTLTVNEKRRYMDKSDEFKNFMLSNWDESQSIELAVIPPKHFVNARRLKLSNQFPKDRLVVKAGTYKVRNNDCDYKFRPFSSFVYLTGLGLDYEPDAVLVFEPVRSLNNHDSNYVKTSKYIYSHICTLYINPPLGRKTSDFYESSHGEFWTGARPSLETFAKATDLHVKPLSELEADLKVKVKHGGITRVLSEESSDSKLFETLDNNRLIKDDWEIKEIQKAVDATKIGFERVIRTFDNAVNKPKAERIVESAFISAALEFGNDVGYSTISASCDHATTLHWMQNNGTFKNGDLLLLDAGVEVDSLYTADITRTMSISGEFDEYQYKIYNIVLEAANEAFKYATTNNIFKDVHDAAIRILENRLTELGILKEGYNVRRWMFHGTSHHLGLDVHDCAKATDERYRNGKLEEGMVITIEPGLYFQKDDLLVPKEYRGIGIRIEDDVLITKDGAKNLSENIPRNAEHLLSWMSRLRSS